jgi:LmbE family N-acetylglucosaminyl deacetylase
MHLYLSPHADDVALSCGGRVFEQARRGEKVVVVTFFAATPQGAAFSAFAQGQHDKWQTETDAMAHRRAEDQAALALLGAQSLYLDYYDCIYRLHPQSGQPMYASEEGIFGDLDAAEAGLPLELAEQVARLANPKEADILAPLTVGHHVDHQLAQRAALALAERGYRIEFYEEHPYATRAGEMVQAALAAWPGALAPVLAPISEEGMRARVAAIACYASQIRTLYGDLATMERDVRRYAAELAPSGGYAERYWRPE